MGKLQAPEQQEALVKAGYRLAEEPYGLVRLAEFQQANGVVPMGVAVFEQRCRGEPGADGLIWLTKPEKGVAEHSPGLRLPTRVSELLAHLDLARAQTDRALMSSGTSASEGKGVQGGQLISRLTEFAGEGDCVLTYFDGPLRAPKLRQGITLETEVHKQSDLRSCPPRHFYTALGVCLCTVEAVKVPCAAAAPVQAERQHLIVTRQLCPLDAPVEHGERHGSATALVHGSTDPQLSIAGKESILRRLFNASGDS